MRKAEYIVGAVSKGRVAPYVSTGAYVAAQLSLPPTNPPVACSHFWRRQQLLKAIHLISTVRFSIPLKFFKLKKNKQKEQANVTSKQMKKTSKEKEEEKQTEQINGQKLPNQWSISVNKWSSY